MTEIFKYELIDKHLLGELSPDEQVLFIQLIEEDSTFRDELENFQLANEVLIDNQLIDLKAKISTDLKTKKRNYKVGIGVVIIGLISLIYVLIPNSNNEDINNIDDNVITPKTEISKTKNEPETENNLINETPHKTKSTTLSDIKVENKTNIQENNEEETITETPTTLDSIETIITDLPDKNDETNTKVSSIINPCDTTQLVASTAVVKTSCKNDNTGMIKLMVTGGTKPYQFSIDNGKSFKSTPTFSFLDAGQYQSIIKDGYGCASNQLSIDIQEVVCMQKSYVFNADYESWKIPDQGEGFELVINNRSNEVIFSKHFENGSSAEWNGTSNTGATTPTGLYIFVIKTDSGIYHKGHITVTR